MRSIITVVGKDTVGILASVSELCAKHEVNIIEVSQSILQEMFCMIMLVDVSMLSLPLSQMKLKSSARIRRLKSTLCMRIFSTPCTEYNPY